MASKFHTSMSELLSRYRLSETFLKGKCSDEHIIMMADKFQDWEKITTLLGVNADDVKACVGKPDSSLYRRKCLQIWKEFAGFKATYYAFLEVLVESRLVDAACNICERLAELLQEQQDRAVISQPASKPLAGAGITRDSLAIPNKVKRGSSTSLTSSSPSSTHHYMSRSANSFTPPSLCRISSSDEADKSFEGHGRISLTTGYSADITTRCRQLYRKFMSIVRKAKECIDETKMQDVILSLCTLPVHLQQKEKCRFLVSKRMELGSLTSAHALMLYLAPYWDELHPDLLSHLIDSLENPALTEECHSYEAELTLFLRDTSLDQVAGKFVGSDYPNGQNVEIELPTERQQSSLLYARHLGDEFGSAINCDAPIRVKNVMINSVHLVLALPYPLDRRVFNRKEVQDFLHSNGVISVTSNGNCLLKNEPPQYAMPCSSEYEKSEDEQSPSHTKEEPKSFEEREKEYLAKLQRKPKKQLSKKISRSSFVLPEVGSRLYHEKEFMIIVSNGDLHPPYVEVARRLPGDESLKKNSRKHPLFEGLALSANLDLNVVANKIALSSVKELTSLALDIKGGERSKAYYLQAVVKFIECCQYPGAYIWYIGHSEKGTGNWCFKDGTISFDEIFDIYKRIQEYKASTMDATMDAIPSMDAVPDDNGKLLAVISDCSYSGNWVHRCAKILDSQKIPPCGHKTNEVALQVRVHCSAQKDQEAQQLCYSVKGVTATRDGDFSYRDAELSVLQHTCCGDFTKLVCCRDPSDLCRMDKDIRDWTWTDVVTGKLRKSTYIIQGNQNKKRCWYIILLFNKGTEFIKKYEAQVKLGEIETSKWGYVLQSGSGEALPKEILNKVTQWTFV